MCSLIAHVQSNHFIKIDTFASNRLVINTVKISKISITPILFDSIAHH